MSLKVEMELRRALDSGMTLWIYLSAVDAAINDDFNDNHVGLLACDQALLRSVRRLFVHIALIQTEQRPI